MDEQPRDTGIFFSMSRLEKKALRAYAKDMGMSEADVIRRALTADTGIFFRQGKLPRGRSKRS